MNFLKSQDLSVSIPIIKRIRTVIGQQINLNKMDGISCQISPLITFNFVSLLFKISNGIKYLFHSLHLIQLHFISLCSTRLYSINPNEVLNVFYVSFFIFFVVCLFYFLIKIKIDVIMLKF
jgi:hypothetical protein